LACERPSAAHNEGKDESDEFAVDLADQLFSMMKALE